MKKNLLQKIFSIVMLMIPLASFAQVPGEKPTFPLEQSFVVVVIAGSLGVIGLIIFVFMKHINAFIKILLEKAKNEKAKTILLLVTSGLLLPAMSSAQNSAAPAESIATSWYSTGNLMFLLLVAVYITLLLIVFWISRHMMKMVKQLYAVEKKSLEPEAEKTSWLDKVLDAFNASVPLHKEKDVLLNHDYDGIKELDNSLPPWWLYGFYITIIFAVVYLFYFHLGGPGLSSTEAYAEEVRLANEQLAANAMKQPSISVDESNVQFLTDDASLADAKSIFTNVCASCHGTRGEGGAGPNLTDEYWIHGGSINEIYHTIKTGVADKAMPQWGATYKAPDLQKLASYVMKLKGSNPPNPKEPQGVLYEPAAPKSDSATASVDSVKK